ncbi:hypothetical protein BBD33_08925 [Elizabethkingia meningoseptica]|nr:hypothetical protein BBD33_08925 [Elizabethkingia meningoseptica]OPB69057.1 hypothetical protein BAY30_06830 [Elizabethkingia meningoseptica]
MGCYFPGVYSIRTKHMKTLNDYIAVYKEQLTKKDIQKAYHGLMKYMMSLKTHIANSLSGQFVFGNLSFGYMDFTYFPFHNDFLRSQKLRFGIVLNHEEMRIELWLMGQNAHVQKKHRDLLKTNHWNKDCEAMPVYSVLEAVLTEDPDFNHPEKLNTEIEKQVVHISEEIIAELKRLKGVHWKYSASLSSIKSFLFLIPALGTSIIV